MEKDALERLIGQFSVPVLHDVLTRIIAAAGAEKLSQIASAIIGVIGTLVRTFGGYQHPPRARDAGASARLRPGLG